MTKLEKLQHIQVVLEEALSMNYRLTRAKCPEIREALQCIEELQSQDKEKSEQNEG